MQYIGGKHRIASKILPFIIKGRKPGQPYIEPFVGGANVIWRRELLGGPRVGADANPYLIAFWKAAQKGWVPRDFTRDEYEKVKASGGAGLPPEQVFWYATAHCISRKWFDTYWERDTASPRYYGLGFAGEFWRSVARQLPFLGSVKFVHSDYRALGYPKNSIVYCDPPYAGSTDPSSYANGLNHGEFWEFYSRLSRHCRVFVSERRAPEDWLEIWGREIQISCNQLNSKGRASARAAEKLFVHRDSDYFR